MPTRWFIGLSSGSSVAGVDAVLVETEGIGLELRARLVHALHSPYPRDLRDLIVRIGTPGNWNPRQASLLHRLLGETFAAAARQVADQASFSLQKVQGIGCPEHSLWLEPDGRFPSALGLGMAAAVAERTGVTTLGDFLPRDLATGGQGVPVAALADYLLFRHPRESRILLHLGGVANLVFLPAGDEFQKVIGFDAGPCCALLDGLMRHLTGGREWHDAGGKHAVQGCCIEPQLQRWLGHPFLQRRPPKSLPRQTFGEEFITQAVQQAQQNKWSLHDLLCTAAHFVARGISGAIQRFLFDRPLPTRFFLSGGGVRNGFLWHLLAQQLAEMPLDRTDAEGIPADMRKAVGFGLLAALTLDGVPANLPSATGAAGARLLGSLTPGSSANWARCLTWMAAQAAPPVFEEV